MHMDFMLTWGEVMELAKSKAFKLITYGALPKPQGRVPYEGVVATAEVATISKQLVR